MYNFYQIFLEYFKYTSVKKYTLLGLSDCIICCMSAVKNRFFKPNNITFSIILTCILLRIINYNIHGNGFLVVNCRNIIFAYFKHKKKIIFRYIIRLNQLQISLENLISLEEYYISFYSKNNNILERRCFL